MTPALTTVSWRAASVCCPARGQENRPSLQDEPPQQESVSAPARSNSKACSDIATLLLTVSAVKIGWFSLGWGGLICSVRGTFQRVRV